MASYEPKTGSFLRVYSENRPPKDPRHYSLEITKKASKPSQTTCRTNYRKTNGHGALIAHFRNIGLHNSDSGVHQSPASTENNGQGIIWSKSEELTKNGSTFPHVIPKSLPNKLMQIVGFRPNVSENQPQNKLPKIPPKL